jgi:hypothetical protein
LFFWLLLTILYIVKFCRPLLIIYQFFLISIIFRSEP